MLKSAKSPFCGVEIGAEAPIWTQTWRQRRRDAAERPDGFCVRTALQTWSKWKLSKKTWGNHGNPPCCVTSKIVDVMVYLEKWGVP